MFKNSRNAFHKTYKNGNILKFISKIVYAGKTSLVSYITAYTKDDNEPFVSGFITFIYVDKETKPMAHDIEIEPKTDEDIELYNQAKNLKKQ